MQLQFDTSFVQWLPHSDLYPQLWEQINLHASSQKTGGAGTVYTVQCRSIQYLWSSSEQQEAGKIYTCKWVEQRRS